MAKKWHQLEKLDHRALKKLQIEREKAAKAVQEAAENKRRLIIGGIGFVALVFIIIFINVMQRRSAELEFKKEREALMVSKVIKYSGNVKCRDLGVWDTLKKKFDFDKEYSFKTEKKSSVEIQLQLENVLKLAEESEMTVNTPDLAKKENKIEKETAKLVSGELTVAIALDGRDLLEIEVGDVVVMGASGLFKIIYDRRKDQGEVVVKNGLVEVFPKRNPRKRIKVSGFYKVTFEGKQVKNPTQASVIQYDWR
jgi:ferric-dicitrate binding protein FerR (iron transport regulator)